MGSTHPQAIKPLFKPALLFIEIIYINSESFIVMIILLSNDAFVEYYWGKVKE